jgi:hypothetical protein
MLFLYSLPAIALVLGGILWWLGPAEDSSDQCKKSELI